MKDALKKTGYDNEEVYFNKLNRELIDKIQQKEKRKKEAQARGFRVIEGGAQDTTSSDARTKSRSPTKKAA